MKYFLLSIHRVLLSLQSWWFGRSGDDKLWWTDESTTVSGDVDIDKPPYWLKENNVMNAQSGARKKQIQCFYRKDVLVGEIETVYGFDQDGNWILRSKEVTSYHHLTYERGIWREGRWG